MTEPTKLQQLQGCCVTLKVCDIYDFCDVFEIDSEELMDSVCDSDISFGTNPDTLLNVPSLKGFVEKIGHKWPEGIDENLWFSLGS